MSSPAFFTDLHCHPNFKPYGQSFTGEGTPLDSQPHDEISLWPSNGISEGDSISQTLGVARYTQSHFDAAATAGLQVLGVSLGALEQEFITVSKPLPKKILDVFTAVSLGSLDLQNFFCNLVTRFGVARLNKVREAKAYFPDLLAELEFIRRQEGKVVSLGGKHYTFKIANSGAMITDILADNAAADAGSMEKPITLCLILSMEGLHNLDAGQGADEATVLNHAQVLKGAGMPMFFVTFCHHFWNGLCGHAQSLPGLLGDVFDQHEHQGDGLHPMGLKVLMTLLDRKLGRRVLIDIKHMSYKARTQYLNLLAGSMPDDLEMSPELRTMVKKFFRFNTKAIAGSANAAPPVIVSHAAVNGYIDQGHEMYQGNYPAQTSTGVQSPFENRQIFADPSINFYDADLIGVARFKCLIGIQLDAHRIAGATGLQVASSQLFGHAWLVWNQIIHIVELWDKMGIDGAWDRICIGSDFDGIVSPMDGLHTVADFPALRTGLLHYCSLYFMSTGDFIAEAPGMGERGIIANRFQASARNPSGKRLNPEGSNAPAKTGFTPEMIVDKICSGNMMDFIETYFV